MKKSPVASAYSIYRSSTGYGVLAANEAGLVAHHLPSYAASAARARELAARLHPQASGESLLTSAGARLLAGYFAGQRVLFNLPLQLACFTPFRQTVYRVVAGIPYGTALSYARVAAACGCPRGARAVGGAMASNPLPIFVPCHRVVGANGVMTGFSAPGGVVSKRELLTMEGAVFDARGGLQDDAFCRL